MEPDQNVQEELQPRESVSQMELLLKQYQAHTEIAPRLKELGISQLTEIQYFSVLFKLFQGESLFICAPTSSGKTLIGEMACVNAIFSKKGRCLYLVPLKSLAYEKYRDFRAHWAALNIQVEMSTGDMTILDREKEEEKLQSVDLLITTYERADSILRSHQDWFGTVAVVVVDEVHSVGSESRGARLEGTLLRLKYYFPAIQLVCLSATVGNPEELADWLGCEIIRHDYRPVPLEYQIVLHPSREEKIREIVTSTLQQGGSIILFTPTRFEAERLCSDLSKFIKERELTYLIDYREIRGRLEAFRTEMQEAFDERLFYSLPRGVAFHHAGVSSDTRHFIEDLFHKGLIKIITCTPTLAAGVNLPAKTVVITDVGLIRNYLIISANQLHQMAGRAGRPGFDKSGTAIILAVREGEKYEIELLYFYPHTLIPKYQPVQSQFMEPDNLLEQYLVWIAEAPNGIKEYDLQEMTLKTYWYASQRRRQPDATIRHLLTVGHYSLENILIRHADKATLDAADKILDPQVRIRQMDSHQLEAIIQDRTYIRCCINRDFLACGCGDKGHQKRNDPTLCRHLVKLAQVAYRQAPEYTKNLLLSALQEEHLIDKLLKYRMIKILNGRLTITEFGRQIVLLYLTPQVGYWIRLHLPRIETPEQLYRDLIYVFEQERKWRKIQGFETALKRLLEEDYPDLAYQMQKVGHDLNIYPGDMEEFVESMRWILHSFTLLAQLDGIEPVLRMAQIALEKLIPPTEEEE